MELNYNRVELRGVAEDAPLLSHVNHGCAFYRFTLSVLRLSGQADKLPVIVPRPLLLLTPVSPGDGVHITGQLRSFNNKSGQGSRLVISTFAQTLTHDAGEPLNRIFLSGVLCKQPALRRTPLGREICDMILAVNRRYGRADYLPCIAWGAVAQQVSLLHTGARLTAEPCLLQNGERRHHRPHCLRGVHHASGGPDGIPGITRFLRPFPPILRRCLRRKTGILPVAPRLVLW